MNDQFKKFLNEEQDPKAIEKITAKLNDLLMKGEEVAYIGVQKKPAINVFPDSIVLTNKRIIMCRPKNLGLSMDYTDYSWEELTGSVVKENILGSEFSFSTKTGIQVSIDYIPKTQARKIHTFAREQQEMLKQVPDNGQQAPIATTDTIEREEENMAALETEEVTHFAEIIPMEQSGYRDEKQHPDLTPDAEEEKEQEKSLGELSSDELFDKLQNYKKLLDNGLILQTEYDALKREILVYM